MYTVVIVSKMRWWAAMNVFKRALTNIKRQPVKNGILFLLILILGTAASSAISIGQAINNTEESMMLHTPAIATMALNVHAIAEETGIAQTQLGSEFWHTSRPTREDISAIGNLPYVRAYDATMLASIFSQNLEWAMVEIDEQQLPELPEGLDLSSLEQSISGFRPSGGRVEHFGVRGVANPELTDIDTGLIHLVDGQIFTQAEIDHKAQVVIVSQLFAEANDLYVGAVIELENIVHDTPAMQREEIGFYPLYWHEERFMAAHQLLEFEVIGIFDTYHGFDYQSHDDSDWWIQTALMEYARVHNQIYMPISVTEDILNFQNEGARLIIDDLLELLPGHTTEDFIREEPWIESVFILYDPRDLEAFQSAGTELLPGFWEITDLRGVHASLVNSMDTMNSIADGILLASVATTVTVLALIITLLLRDRRHEIGIYMALGEKKGKVVFQFLIEIMIVSTVAMMVALFAGNGLSATISRNLFEQHLIENMAADQIQFGDGALPWELALFNPGELSVEETLAMYDTSLGIEAVVAFVGAGSAVILLSTTIPIIYIVKLEPKKILM